MTHNFGDGYKGKRYEDAACEVAWNKIQRAQREGFKFEYYCPSGLFAGEGARVITIYPWSGHNIFETPSTMTFPAFRKAFLKWCENNRRKG